MLAEMLEMPDAGAIEILAEMLEMPDAGAIEILAEMLEMLGPDAGADAGY